MDINRAVDAVKNKELEKARISYSLACFGNIAQLLRSDGDILSTFNVEKITQNTYENIIPLYSKVFAGPPWYEEKKCKICGERYGGSTDWRFINPVGVIKCRSCKEDLVIEEFWDYITTKNLMSTALSTNRFLGLSLNINISGENVPIAFSWGYAIPKNDEPSVKFSKCYNLFILKNINPDSTFYVADTGIMTEYQNKKIGTAISYLHLIEAYNNNFTGVSFRTINPYIIKIYEKIFGSKNITELFNDPEHNKSERKWYYCNFENRLSYEHLLYILNYNK